MKKHHRLTKLLIVCVAILIVAFVFFHKNVFLKESKPLATTKDSKTSQTSTSSSTSTSSAKPVAVNECSGNSLSQLLLVSISQRHVWACSGTTELYDSSVITGDMDIVADATPTGTYHIYAKQTDRYLKGCDVNGCWNDYVNYWMPFLDNQYGAYGFHDATWRASNAFGNISQYTDQASHGCVEMPLTAANWVYNWAQVGTTVTVEA